MFKLKIRYKILLLILFVSILSLSSFTWLSISEFKKDKINSIFAQQSLDVTSTSKQIRLIIDSDISLVKESFNKFVLGTERSFDNEKFFAARLVSPSQDANPVDLIPSHSTEASALLEAFQKKALILEITKPEMFFLKESPNVYALVVPTKVGSNNNDSRLLISLINSEKIRDLFNALSTSNRYLLQDNNLVLWEGEDSLFTSNMIKKLVSASANKNIQKGSFIFSDDDKAKELLVSYSKVGRGQMMVLSVTPSSEAFFAIQMMLRKAILALVAIISLAIATSIIISRKVTSALRQLYEGTLRIGEGDFDVNLNIRSGDEVENVAAGFNEMAKEVKHLLIKTAESARLESEIKTANMVQDTFFPDRSAKLDGMEILVYNQMASECGGDFCHYFETEDYNFTMIGDALGHGVGAALLTSAARSACTALERLGLTDPAAMLEFLNDAIFETCRTKMWMSFFICRVDKVTKEVTYSSASHPVPLVFRQSEGIVETDMLNLSLGDMVGTGPGAKYVSQKLELQENDILLFYTDGLTEMKNPEGKEYGEMRVVRKMKKIVKTLPNLLAMSDELQKDYNAFRKEVELDDDVTFMFCKIKGRDGNSETQN